MSFEIDADFRFYCTTCKQHTFTKFEDLQNNTNGRCLGADSGFQNGHMDAAGPYKVGMCLTCGTNAVLYISVHQNLVTQDQLVDLVQRENQKTAEVLEKAKQQQKREGSLI